MIRDLEQKTKRELVEIVKIQQEEFIAQSKQLEWLVEHYEFCLASAEAKIKELRHD